MFKYCLETVKIYHNLTTVPKQQFFLYFVGELSVSGRLNYSSANSYQLTLKAIDSLTGSWSEGECAIKVLDINDNVPMFEKPFYDLIVEEDVAVGMYELIFSSPIKTTLQKI